MKTIAIIAEFNPFHNGHLYLLNKAMEITHADYSIALISGNFTQRGTPAICDKFTRAYMAAVSGIDMCLELPYVYATGSAYDFANGAVSILNSLNSIDYLCFGAETDEVNIFDEISDIIVNEPKNYLIVLKSGLKNGLSFPSARQNAIVDFMFNEKSNDLKITKEKLIDIISKPNNILAIEYISALKRTNSNIKPIIIKRESSDYKETQLNGSRSSALAIRNAVKNIDISDLEHVLINEMPQRAFQIFIEKAKKEYPVSHSLLLPFLQAKCLDNIIHDSDICDFNLSLINKLSKIDLCKSYDEIIKELKTKEITEARINRALLHLIMGYSSKDRDDFYKYNTSFYASILSFRKSATNLIKSINNKSTIPVITKKADFDKYLSSYPEISNLIAKKMWEFDLKASELYRMSIYNNSGYIIPNDYTFGIPIA